MMRLLNVFLVFSLAACSSNPSAVGDAPATAAVVDLPPYMGTWYEMARLPMPYQEQCVSEVQAHYRLNKDNSVSVENSCRNQTGAISRVEGLATVVDDSGAKLQVSFLPKFIRWLPVGKAAYWILRIDEDYRHALVGTPEREYLWILSRSPNMDDDVLQSYIDSAQAQGYDTANLIRNP